MYIITAPETSLPLIRNPLSARNEANMVITKEDITNRIFTTYNGTKAKMDIDRIETELDFIDSYYRTNLLLLPVERELFISDSKEALLKISKEYPLELSVEEVSVVIEKIKAFDAELAESKKSNRRPAKQKGSKKPKKEKAPKKVKKPKKIRKLK